MDGSAVTQIERRQFLKLSAAAGGALVLGFTLPRARAGAGTAPLNAYVTITPAGRARLVMPKTEMGQGIYTSLAMMIAEELEVDLAAVDVVPAPPAPDIYGVEGDQSTGGSTSTRDCWVRLREAGAVARTMLVTAAARQWGVPAGDCQAEHGVVTHKASGRSARYGELAAAAAGLPVPKPPKLKDWQDYKVIGRSTPRLEGRSKVFGTAVFGIDARPPGMKYAALALSPVLGGRAATPLNEAAALAVRGVRQVVNDGDAVAVVADGTWAAMKGLEALQLKWHDGPNGDVQQAGLVAELVQAVKDKGAVASDRGDVSKAMAEAATRVEVQYQQPFLAHATLEPMNATVHWRPEGVEIWTGTQAPDRVVAKVAELGVKPASITVHNHVIGGGFGRRLEVDGVVVAARIARHVTGPVQVLYRREQDIQHDRYRPYYVDHIQAGLDAQGRPVAWTHTVAGASATAAWYGESALKNGLDDDAVEVARDPVYTLPNLLVRYVRHEPRGLLTSWWRGVGPTRSVFVVESFIDELAAAAKQDPMAYRVSLIRDPRTHAVLQEVARRSGWGTPLKPHHGRGVAVQYAFGSYLAAVVEVVAEPGQQPKLARVTAVLDCGQMVNPDNIRQQMEGGILFGLTAAMQSEVTIANGRVQQSNYNDYQVMRMSEAPPMDMHLIVNHEAPGGIGETGTAVAAAALCNAIHAASGQRLRTLPVTRSYKT